LIIKICPICNKEFHLQTWQERAGNRKYCSHECSYKRPNQGGYHAGSVRSYKSGWYESPIAGRVWLDSSYEFIMAKYLDSKNYQWVKNTQKFPYKKIMEDYTETIANYVPDFYIKDIDLWVETKGWICENDNRKIASFSHKIKLITKKTINDTSTWGF
jgi:hypothetical protein